ncbi:MAG: winged helix-turn-helix domain-containing protein [Pseudomonadota bacterium]
MDGSHRTLPEAFRIGRVVADPQCNIIRGKHSEFSLEPRIMDVLCVLVEHAGDVVPRDVLIEQVWNVEHGGDDSLSRAISLLRKTLRDAGETNTVIETIPKRGYKLSLPVERLNRETTAGTFLGGVPSIKARTIGPLRSSWDGRVVWGLLTLLMGVGGFFLFQVSRPAPETQTVTVEIDRVWLAPVETVDASPATELFASNLRAQMSTQMLANGLFTTLSPGGEETGQKFDIATRVDEAEGELRVTVNLIDHPSQLLLWSRVFEPTGEETQAFDLTVSTRLAGVLGCMTRWRPDFRETPVETLALYARFCERLYDMKMGDFLTFTQPIYETDPTNPYAVSLQAWAIVIEAKHQDNRDDGEALFSEAEDLIAPILEVDPEHPFGNFVAGLISWTRSGGKDLIQVENRMRLASAPQAMPDEFYTLYSNFLRSVGRFSAASDMFYKAASNHPNDPELLTQMGWIFASLGDYGAMERQFERAAEIDPDLWLLHLRRLQSKVFLQDDPADALAFLSRPPEGNYQEPQNYQTCYRVFLRLKQGVLDDPNALDAACRGVAYHWPMRMYVALGEIERAWELIENNADATVYDETIIHFYPDMEPFRQDPRFWIMMDRYGLVDYWQTTDRWPDFCSLEALPVDCRTMANRVISETD